MPDERVAADPRIRARKTVTRVFFVVIVLVGLGITALSDTAGQWRLQAAGGIPRCLNDIGISPGSFGGVSDADFLRDLAEIRRVGATRIRFDVDWSAIEPVRGKYDWTRTDFIVNAIAEARLTPLALVTYAPKWAQVPGVPSGSHGAPANPADFANFARHVVERYGSVIQQWEIWNEPNLDIFWSPTPNAAAYADLVRVTSAAIKAVQPDAIVVAGALSSGADSNSGEVDPVTFIEQMYAADAGGSFDALSVHPYTFPAMPTDPDPDGTNTFRKIPRMHEIMVKRGDGGKNIWITEFGAPTGTGRAALTQLGQAETLSIGVAAARSLGYIPAIFIYSVRDSGTDTADLYQNFGLMTKAFVPKRAYGEVKTLTALTEC